MAKIKLVGTLLDNDSAQIYSWFGMDAIAAKTVEKAIYELKDGEVLEIDLNSPGGYCSVGAEIYTLLRQASDAGHRVTVNVVGEACSAATVLMCGADEVNGSAVSYFMFHNASISAYGKARDLRSATECLEQIDETIVNAYEKKTGRSREELHKLIDSETWMSVNKAKEYGFVDNIMFEEKQEEDDPKDDQKVIDTVKACAISHKIIPEDKLKLMRDVMISEMAKENRTISGQKKDVNADSININVNKKGDSSKMTLNEVYEQHPELKDEVNALLQSQMTSNYLNGEKTQNVEEKIQAAIMTERKRIQDIETIAGIIPGNMVKDAKYDNPCDAKELAFKALAADNQKRKDYLQNAIDDSDNSGVKDVVTKPDEAEDNKADELAGYVNAKKGAKRG